MKHIIGKVSKAGDKFCIFIPKEYQDRLKYRDVVVIVPIDNVLDDLVDRIKQRT